MVIGIIFFAMAVAIAVSMPFLKRYAENKAAGGRPKAKKGKLQPLESRGSARGKKTLKDIFDILDIQNGVVYLTKNRYSAVLKLGAVNFYLLSEADQQQIESALMAMATGLNFNLQFFSTTEVVDTTGAIELLSVCRAKEKSEVRANYADALLDYLTDLMARRMVLAKNTYAVVTVQDPDQKKALAKLSYCCTQLVRALDTAKVTAMLLSSEEVVNLLYRTLNRRRPFRPADAVAAGALEYYTRKRERKRIAEAKEKELATA